MNGSYDVAQVNPENGGGVVEGPSEGADAASALAVVTSPLAEEADLDDPWSQGPLPGVLFSKMKEQIFPSMNITHYSQVHTAIAQLRDNLLCIVT